MKISRIKKIIVAAFFIGFAFLSNQDVQAQANPIERPFGGPIIMSIPCTCSNSYLNYVYDDITRTVLPLVAVPGFTHFYGLCHIGIVPYPPINGAQFFCSGIDLATSLIPPILPLYHLGLYVVMPNEICQITLPNGSCKGIEAFGIYDGGRGYLPPGTGTSYNGSTKSFAGTPFIPQQVGQRCAIDSNSS